MNVRIALMCALLITGIVTTGLVIVFGTSYFLNVQPTIKFTNHVEYYVDNGTVYANIHVDANGIGYIKIERIAVITSPRVHAEVSKSIHTFTAEVLITIPVTVPENVTIVVYTDKGVFSDTLHIRCNQ